MAAVALLLIFGRPVLAAPGDPLRPFPRHQAYAPGSIKPSHVTQAALDAKVAALYAQWKAGFLRAGCTPGRFYVWHGGHGGGGTAGSTIGVSEGQGYGMIIAALMAGRDPDARAVFDGLYAYFRDHPSVNSPDLMAWQQLEGCVDSDDADSAADGDLDIAYALLLADRQWGSAGAVAYAAEAAKVIAAVKAEEINPQTSLPQLGDWVGVGDPKTYFATRSSDWMMAHFKAFQAATGDAGWLLAADNSYRLLAAVQARYAPATGLVPDFAVDTQATARPAPAAFLGEGTGNRYGWNACRVPWRVATDFLLYGDQRARSAVGRLEDWYRAKTGGKPAKVRATRALAGGVIENYSELAFTAPIGVGAMVDARYQPWLNALWDATVKAPYDASDYYGNTLRLLTTLVMSGNWWKP